MNGIEFYAFLRQTYLHNGQELYDDFTFCKWLFKSKTNTYSFQFNILNNGTKSIPQHVIIVAWNANSIINNDWLIDNFGLNFHNDCRLYVLKFLINFHQNLR